MRRTTKTPTLHFTSTQRKTRITKKDIKITQKCLGYGEEKEDGTDGTHGSTTADTAADDNIDIGDLDALFAEDTEPTG